MGVPNTSTFTLQDVVNEVNPTTDDLVDCFSDAILAGFDSAYEGSKNQLLNFRNYSSLSPFFLTLDEKFPCSSLTEDQSYHNGSGTLAVVGDIVYDDSSGTTLKSSGRYGQASTDHSSPTNKIEINGSGTITVLTIC